MKFLAFMFLALALTACANTAQTQRNTLGSVEAAYGTAQSAALVYARRPLCAPGAGITVNNVCADRATVRVMQAADRSAMAAIETVHAAVKENPNDPNIPAMISAANAGVVAFTSTVPK